MSEFTKGEWQNTGLEIEVFGRGIIAQCPTTNNGGVMECVENAELIASAPTLKQQRDDLLEACKAQKKADKWFGPSDTGWKLKETARMLVEAAITKCEA